MQISQEAREFLDKQYKNNPELIIIGFQAPTMMCCYITNKPYIFLLTLKEFQKTIRQEKAKMTDFVRKHVSDLNIPVFWHKKIKNYWETAEVDLTSEQQLILFLHDTLS